MNPTIINVLIMNLKSSLGAVLIILLAFLTPIAPLLILVGLAIGADTIFGIVRSVKKKRAITSRRLSALVSKMFLYQFATIGMYIVDKYLVGELIMVFTDIPLVLTKLVVATLLSIELKSINENIESGFGLNIWDKFKYMLRRAKSIKDELEDNEQEYKE